MVTQEFFLRAITPPDTYLALVGIKNGIPKQMLVPDIAAALPIIARWHASQRDVYFGCAGYRTTDNRKQSNVSCAQSFWVDLDCGDGTPYLDQVAGVEAVHQFCAQTHMPTPWIVDSGRGLHLYWTLEEPIAPAVWQRGAAHLMALATQHNLRIKDPTCSTDIARILRVPGTENFKTPATPQPVSVLHQGSPAAFGMLRDILVTAPIAPQAVHAPRITAAPGPDATMQALLQSDMVSNFKAIVRKSMAGTGCAHIAQTAVDPNTVQYNLWRAVLSVAKFCEDGLVGAHRISKGYASYNPSEVDRKLLDIVGPYTCAKFHEAGDPALCGVCSHQGKIKSPIMLSRNVLDVSAALPLDRDGSPILPQDSRTFKVGSVTRTMLHTALPPLYLRGGSGGIYRKGQAAPDGTKGDDIQIYPYNLNISARVNDAERGECLLCTLELPHDEIKEFIIPTATMIQPELLKSQLAKHGVIGHKGRMTDVSTYIVSAAMHLQEISPATPSVTQMGWNITKDAFIIGRKVYTQENPKGVYCPPADTCREIAQRLGTNGSFDVWHGLVSQFGAQGGELRAMALLIAMGSMLNPFLDDCDPIWLHLVSSRSGTGKTTLMHLMNGIWGHPKAMMLGPTDTYNALSKIRIVHNNIAVCQDEITNMDALALSRIAYSQSQDRDKNRLDASAKARPNFDTRANTFITSGNRYVTDVIGATKSCSDGEMARILQIRFDPIDNVMQSGVGFGQARTNYGHCGDMLATWAVSHQDELQSRVNSTVNSWKAKMSSSNSERNWIGSTATGMAMLDICQNELGILKTYDKNRITASWVQLIENTRQNVVQSRDNHIDILGDFINENHANILLPDTSTEATAGLSNRREHPVRDARMKIVIRVERDTGQFFVSVAELKTYCTKRSHSYLELVSYFSGRPEFLGTMSKRFGEGAGVVAAPTQALVFNTHAAAWVELGVL